jgi:hypothetical protein
MLLKGFNTTFLDLLLYDHEKEALQPYLTSLSHISSSSSSSHPSSSSISPSDLDISYAHHFGLIHLLRYLIFVIAKESSLKKEDFLEERDGRSERSSRKKRGKSEVAAAEVEEGERSKEEILLEEVQLLAIKALDLLATDAFFPFLS